MEIKRYAGIDIGSNATRLIIKDVLPGESYDKAVLKKRLYVRLPVRLGADVFEYGKIKQQKKQNFIDAITIYQRLLDFYNVKQFRACATSAVRDAKNGETVIKEIRKLTGIRIDIIDINEEANLIFETNKDHLTPQNTYLSADLGGGSLQLSLFKGEKLFSYPKSLYTVKDTIHIFTNSKDGDIVLDFFGGSATTAHAVLELNKEDDGNRQFIITEQLDYIETVTAKRVQKVIKQNKQDSFTYLELKKYNQNFIDQIEEAKDSKALLKIWEQMKEKSFLNYNIDIQKQEEHIEEFKQLELAQQKEHLVELLDKNQLYVNLSSLNDKDFECSKEEKQVTKDFYKIKKD